MWPQFCVYGFLHGRFETPLSEIYYKTVYNCATLEQALLTTGFSSVQPYDWHQTIHKNYDDYSPAYVAHMDKEHGVMMSLNVEATN